MTVSELKELLNKCDNDMEVVVYDEDGELDIDMNPIFISNDDKLVLYCNDESVYIEDEEDGEAEDEEDISYNFWVKQFLT